MEKMKRVSPFSGNDPMIVGTNADGIGKLLGKDLEENAKKAGMSAEEFKELLDQLDAENEYIKEQEEADG